MYRNVTNRRKTFEASKSRCQDSNLHPPVYKQGLYPELKRHGADNGTWTRTTRFETWHAIPITSYLQIGERRKTEVWLSLAFISLGGMISSLYLPSQISYHVSFGGTARYDFFNHSGGNHRTFYRSKLPTSGVEPDLFRCTKPCAWLTCWTTQVLNPQPFHNIARVMWTVLSD